MNIRFSPRSVRGLALATLLIPGALSVQASARPPRGPRSPAPVAKPTTSTDIKKLAQIVNLPRRPLSATWRYERIGDGNMGPSDARLTAALLFSQRDAEALAATARRQLRANEIVVQPWFPAALRKKAIKKSDGRLVLLAFQLDSSGFHKSPLQNGGLLRVLGTNYCVLSLFTT